MRTASVVAVVVATLAAACGSDTDPTDDRLTVPGSQEQIDCDHVIGPGVTNFAGVFDLEWYCGGVTGGGPCDPDTMQLALPAEMTIAAAGAWRYSVSVGGGMASLSQTNMDSSPADSEDLAIGSIDGDSFSVVACTNGSFEVLFLDAVDGTTTGWFAAATRR